MSEHSTRDSTLPSKTIELDARYRRLFETALEGILFVDATTTISYANARLARMLGYNTAEELIGKHAFDLLFPEDLEEANQRWAVRLAGGEGEHELPLQRKDGSACWVVAHISVERTPSGVFAGTFNLFTDISAQREALEALRAKNREIVTILESMTDAFASFDTDWRFVYTNPAAARILGRSAQDLIGKCIWDEFEGSRDTIVFEEYNRAVREQKTVAFELYYGTLLGWFEVRAYPSLTGLSAYFRDISAQKAAEQERERAAQEKAYLLEELQSAARKQRRFLREMLYSLTEGRLRLCDSADELPELLTPILQPADLTLRGLSTFRRAACAIAADLGLPGDRIQDIETGIGEASMNAVRHAGGGTGAVYGSAESGTIQIWVTDEGAGISEDSLHRATLEKGYSSAGTLGHGFWLMLKTCDRIFLLTGPQGTTVVLEQERAMPEPSWIRDFDQTTALKMD